MRQLLMIVAPAAMTAVMVSGLSGHTQTGPAATTAHAEGGVPVVVTRAEAVRPHRGTDYRLLTTLRGSDASRAEGVTADGKVVLGYSARSGHLAVLNPITDHRHALPIMGDARLLRTDGSTWWLVHEAGRDRPSVLRLDRTTGQVRHFTLPEVPSRQHYTIIGVDGATVWFTTGRAVDDASPDRVWSVEFGRAGTLRAQGRRSAATLAGGMLAWVVRSSYGTDGMPEGPDVIASRAATGGPVTRVPLPGLCQVGSRRGDLMGNGRRIVVNTHCSDRSGPAGPATELRSQPTFVVDPTVGVETELRVESDEAAQRVSSRTVTFYGYSYDLATGRLFALPDPQGLGGLPPLTGEGVAPVALWTKGYGDHAIVRVVRLAHP